jgi:hypothetical protein
MTKRRNADGSEARYYQLAENHRDPERGCAVAKVIYNFGRAEQLDADQLRRLAASILRVVPDETAPSADPTAAGGDVPQKAPHDLSGTGFGQGVGETDVGGPGQGTDLPGHVLAQSFLQFRRRLFADFQSDEPHHGLPRKVVGPAHHSGLGHIVMAHQSALNFRGAQPVAGHLDDVVDTTHNPKVSVLVSPSAVSGEIKARDLAPILFFLPF